MSATCEVMENRRTRRFGDHKTNTVLALNGVVSKGGVGRSEETILLIKKKNQGMIQDQIIAKDWVLPIFCCYYQVL